MHTYAPKNSTIIALYAFKAAIRNMGGMITQTAKIHARTWQQRFDAYVQQRQKRQGKLIGVPPEWTS
jgi:hypothetical protein